MRENRFLDLASKILYYLKLCLTKNFVSWKLSMSQTFGFPVEYKQQKENQLFKTYRASETIVQLLTCLLYTSPSPRDATLSRMPSSA